MNELLNLLRLLLAVAVLVGIGYVLWQRFGGRIPRLMDSSDGARLCPQLGLSSDPFSNSAHPDEEHRCYANLARERIDLGHQQRFCLSSNYKRCPFLAVSTHEEGLTGRARAWWRNVSPAAGTLAIDLQPRLQARLETMAASLLVAVRGRVEAMRQPKAPAHAAAAVAVADERAAELPEMPKPMPVAMAPEWAPVRAEVQETHEVREVHEEIVAPATYMAEKLKMAAAHAVEVHEEVAAPHAALLTRAWIEEAAPMSVEEPEPELEPEPVAFAERDLVSAGIARLEAGDEQQAYQLFKRASKANSHDVHAWYWRAKTAETLDEVVDCLTKAQALDPNNVKIAANLLRARERQHAPTVNATPVTKPEDVKKQIKSRTERPAWTVRRPNIAQRSLRLVLELARAQASLAAFAIGAVWLLTAMPPVLRDNLMSSTGMSWLVLPDTTRLAELVHIQLAGGYEVASALPFMIGFLAVFVGVGLMGDDGWTRFWAPVVGIASAWVWAASPVGQISPLLLPACGIVVVGGAVSTEWGVLRRRLSPA